MTSKSYYYLFIIFILACSFIFFCFSIINEQYKYGYVRYNSDLNPKNYNYLNYKIFSKIDYFKKKNFSNFNNNTLAAVKILIPKKSLNYYKKNAPDSNKKWVNGFAYDEIKNKTYSIDLRPRGDNPSNWSFNKKSWKVKIDKKDFKGGIRKYYYELPRIEDEFYGLKFYSAYFLSREMGLPTPKIRFVELFINGINMGYYYELEQIDESFLRNNNLMPVNIYKGENYHIDSAIDTGDDLFNNSGLWTKLSYFNQKSKEDKTDLIRHLNKINLFEGGRINPNNFFDYFPVEKWAKHILSYGSVHSSNWHNQRLIIDPWSGEAVPIIHDPDFLNLNNNLLKSGNGDRAERVLNFNPEFHYYKYKLYKEFFIDKKIISKLINEINLFRDDLAKAIVKDFDYNFFKKSVMPKSNKLNIDLVNKNIDRYIENLKTLTTNKIFESQLKSTWNSNSNILNINNSDILPISKIKIVFKEPINKKQFKIILKNNNKFFQNQIIPIEVIDKHSIFLDVIIVADRVPISNYNENSSRANIAENLLIRPTKFEFNFSNINQIPEIEKIYIENIIDNKFEEIKKSQKNAFNPSVHNYGITKLLENKNLILNGKIIVKKNTIFDSIVTILPGTQFLLYENVSMIFKNKVFFKGSQSNPITVSSVYKENKKPWGALAIVGQKTKGSTLSNVKITDGSGDNFENYQFTGMLSIHNSGDIKINNLNMENNHVYDDMVHFVYVDNIKIENTKLNNIYSDAIDIDSSSNIHISNLNISKSGNDCIDFMQTLAKIDNSSFSFCNDKGISVGERSKIIITNSVINSSKIGIESKDDSEVNIDSSKFYKNNIDMNAYKKNWRYGVGGRINYDKIDFDRKKVSTDKFSKIKEL